MQIELNILYCLFVIGVLEQLKRSISSPNFYISLTMGVWTSNQLIDKCWNVVRKNRIGSWIFWSTMLTLESMLVFQNNTDYRFVQNILHSVLQPEV